MLKMNLCLGKHFELKLLFLALSLRRVVIQVTTNNEIFVQNVLKVSEKVKSLLYTIEYDRRAGPYIRLCTIVETMCLFTCTPPTRVHPHLTHTHTHTYIYALQSSNKNR